MVLLLPVVASAELAVCFNSTFALGQQFYSFDGISPKEFTTANDPNCSLVPKGPNIQPQRDLIASTVTRPSGTCPAPQYLKLEGVNPNALAVLMPEAEMVQVDNARAAKQQQQQNMADERANNQFCNNETLAQIDSKIQQRQQTFLDAANAKQATIQGQIDALPGTGSATYVHMKQMGTALNNGTFDDVAANLIGDLYDIARQLTRCLRARTGG